ncbi:MAG: sugar phosphate isomerase/epimerase [Thaumarchaeota archaeon]|nr:sugar phosphate isomerase/epimerase [Nitrososphaerota archaeon]
MNETLVLSGLYRWYQKFVFHDRIPEVEKSFVNLNLLEPHYREIFSSLSSSGYDGIEGFLELPMIGEKSQPLKHLLEEYDLQMPVAYANSTLHDSKISEKSIETFLALTRQAIDSGVRYLDINPEPSENEKSAKEISWETASIDTLSRKLKDLGALITIHYHDEMMRRDAMELIHILENTDPDLVKLTLDFHWAFRAGIDPLELLDRYSSRVVALHLRNSVNGVWIEALQDGDVDYKKVATMLNAVNWQGLIVVELANEKGMNKNHSIEDNHKSSREYVKKTFGA